MARTSTSLAGLYAELHTHSRYSLLDGVPTPEQLLDRAAELGLPALALTDHNTLAGLPAFYQHALAVGVKPILGTQVTLEDGSCLTLLAETDAGYQNLARLLTIRNTASPVSLRWNDLKQNTKGLIALTDGRTGPVARAVIANDLNSANHWLTYLIKLFGSQHLYVELQRHLGRDDVKISRRLAALAAERGLPCVATGNVHYLSPDEAPLHQALISLQTHTQSAGPTSHEYFMRTPRAMADLFADLPEAVTNTIVLAQRCNAQPTANALPAFALPADTNADEYLQQLCEPRISRHFANNPDQARVWLTQELSEIRQLGIAHYFLIASDLVSFLERQGIVYQTHGQSSNGIVAALLGLSLTAPTAPARYTRLPHFDFEIDAARHTAVQSYLQERWGADHLGQAATYLTYKAPAALREAGFVLGLNPEAIAELTNALSTSELIDPPIERLAHRLQSTRLTPPQRQQLFVLAAQLQGRPYALAANASQLILSAQPLAQALPLAETNVSQYDHLGLQALGQVTLGLHRRVMLSAIADALSFIPAEERPADLQSLPTNDPAVYALIASARTLGVFQESAGQPAALIPHLQSLSYADLVIESSLILHPGLLRHNMVQHYLHRRQGAEPVLYAQPFLEPILRDTLGVLVFEEQAAQIAQQVAGFTPIQAQALCLAFTAPDPAEALLRFQSDFIQGALARAIPYETAEQVWNMLAVFASDSLSKAQATALATRVYQSAWLRLNQPAAYFCALLRQAHVGSYPASILEAEAVRAGLKFLPCDINRSQALPTLERGAIRHGLVQMNGIDAATADLILLARGNRHFRSLTDLIERTHLERRNLEWLILSGAFDTLGYRPHLLWELAEAFNVARRPQPAEPDNAYIDFDDQPDEQSLFMKFAATSQAARMRLTEARRDSFTKAGCLVWGKLRKARVGAKVKVGGLVVEGLQRPTETNGFAFLRIDEPEGSIKVNIPPAVYTTDRQALRSAFLVIEGTVESQGHSVVIVARKVQALS